MSETVRAACDTAATAVCDAESSSTKAKATNIVFVTDGKMTPRGFAPVPVGERDTRPRAVLPTPLVDALPDLPFSAMIGMARRTADRSPREVKTQTFGVFAGAAAAGASCQVELSLHQRATAGDAATGGKRKREDTATAAEIMLTLKLRAGDALDIVPPKEDSPFVLKIRVREIPPKGFAWIEFKDSRR
jgi:hypothetical protein